MAQETIPAVFSLSRVKGAGWKVYHPERGYIGQLKRKTANGCRRLLREAREAAGESEFARSALALGHAGRTSLPESQR